MALVKNNLNINFSHGLDTKTDPFQVQPGKFLDLTNTIFTKGGLLQKRNGFEPLPSLPDDTNTFTTTYNGNLMALGNKLEAFALGANSWTDRGQLQPVKLDTLPLIQNSFPITQSDSAVAPNGLVCVVTSTAQNSVMLYSYSVLDSTTGQTVVGPVALPSGFTATPRSPSVYLLGKYFIVVFHALIGPVNHLQYIAVNSVIPLQASPATDISTQYAPSNTSAVDGVVANSSLYLAWNGSDAGGAIRMTRIDSNLNPHITVIFPGKMATLMSVTADVTGNTPNIWATFWNSTTNQAYTLIVDQNLNTVLAPTLLFTIAGVANIATTAQNNQLLAIYEIATSYAYDPSIATDYLNTITCSSVGVVGPTSVLIRSLGLASKAFLINGTTYVLAAYGSTFQPTYFLLDQTGNIIAKLAYSNGAGFYKTGLPNVTVSGTIVQLSYLFKDLIEAVNKSQGVANVGGVYSQTGVYLATFDLSITDIVTAEIGSNLQISGGFLWMYDGFAPMENNFHLWPDYVEATWSATGGSIAAQPDGATNTDAYFYIATYEWSDMNTFRSAPSIPISVTTTGSGTAGSITVHVPTLRTTYKTPVNAAGAAVSIPIPAAKIVLYRWSVAQQVYYQVTSINHPLLNDVTVDSVTFVDTQSDAQIIGNNVLYTSGGVIENIGPPAVSTMTLFQSRLFLVDAEDQNLLWFSKQVIENTPVEMSDLFTIYVAPTISAQGTTGPMKALAALDDKLIIFKDNAMYYITGSGPDNTGANNQYSEPIFITATVGCSNQHSIVFTPQGLMFQSDKGIWLLGRDLSTQYIGAPVEEFNDSVVLSALNIPGTNQVRFTLDNGITLMYDYYFGQWGTFNGIPAVSSTLYNGLHTYINALGQVFQETPDLYVDGGNPVLMSFTTSWFNLAGLQGYERAYFFYLLGTYISPHKLVLGISYDYNEYPTQQTVISPVNFNPTYGGDSLYGGSSPYGGNSPIEQWRVFLKQQRCQAFQITLNEQFDASFGIQPGAGLTLSGLNLVVGAKRSYTTLNPARSAG